jgi:hypothetical protein
VIYSLKSAASGRISDTRPLLAGISPIHGAIEGAAMGVITRMP